MAGAQAGVRPMRQPAATSLIRRAVIAFGILGIIAAARAQAPPSEAAKAMASGTWEFSNADRDKRCTLTFRTDAAAAGMRVEFDKGCVGLFPFIADVAGWTLADNDFLRLVDAKGGSVLDFSEVETHMYEAPRPGEGILFIQPSAVVGPPPKQPEQMIGDWGVVRGSGKPICVITLMNAPAGDDLALKLKPGCNALVANFAPTSWQMDRGELVLKNARDQTWRFAEGDATTWTRVPESAQPLLLMRQ